MEQIPEYVWDILEAWLLNKPLNFHNHEVPIEIQMHLSKYVSDGVLGKVPVQEVSK